MPADAAAGAQPEGERKLDHYIIAMRYTDVPPPPCVIGGATWLDVPIG